MFFDSHAHLEAISNLAEKLKEVQSKGVSNIITIGTSLETSKGAQEIAKKYSKEGLKIYSSCGIHPQDGKEEVKKLGLYQCINTLKQITESSNKVIAIGECGLDYYLESSRQRPETSVQDKKFQRELFEEQIKLAQELKLPIVIHCRNAWDEILSPLTTDYRLRTKSTGVFHSWTGDWQAAKRALNLGFYISFSGIVTFKNAKAIVEVAKKTPIDRILVETDSPFLAPEPLRSKQNEPKNVKIITAFLAKLRNIAPDKMAQMTTQNARRLFGI